MTTAIIEGATRRTMRRGKYRSQSRPSSTSHLHRQLVVLSLQQLVPEPCDRRHLQDVVQRRDVFVVGQHQDLQHIYFADVTADVERIPT